MTRTRKETSSIFDLMMGGSPSDFIEAQEARGQTSFVASSQLPTEGLDAIAEKFGIEVHGVTEGDEIFSDVTLPEGWTKRACDDHSMWSELVDADGVVRAMIFYKAASYDRRAHIQEAS